MINETLDNTRRMAADALDRANSTIKDLRSDMSDRAATAQRYIGDYAGYGTRYVADNPLKAALIAAAVGAAVAGVVLAMRHRREQQDRYF